MACVHCLMMVILSVSFFSSPPGPYHSANAAEDASLFFQNAGVVFVVVDEEWKLFGVVTSFSCRSNGRIAAPSTLLIVSRVA